MKIQSDYILLIMTAELSWHLHFLWYDWIISVIIRAKGILTRFGYQAHKFFVKSVLLVGFLTRDQSANLLVTQNEMIDFQQR